MPRYPIDRATNFIIEDESWTVVEYDYTSVPGVIYLSTTEGKVNQIYDDLENNIADTDKLAEYALAVPAEVQTFSVGDIINPSFTLVKNGIPNDAEVELLPTNKRIARIVDNVLTAVGEGETEIIVRLKDFPDIFKTIKINVNNNQEFSAYIEGPATLRLDRIASYILKGTSEIIDEVTFTIDTNLVKIIKQENNKCIVQANDNNKLGSFILTAKYNDIEYTKEITIIPLW